VGHNCIEYLLLLLQFCLVGIEAIYIYMRVPTRVATRSDINIQILTDIDIRIRIFFNTDTDVNTVWNLEPDTDVNTDNYPNPEILNF